MNPCGCWTSPPHPTTCTLGWEGGPLPAHPVKKMPYTSTRLFGSQAGRHDAVLGSLHWPGHPDFIAEGCRILVAMLIPPFDAAVALSGGG